MLSERWGGVAGWWRAYVPIPSHLGIVHILWLGVLPCVHVLLCDHL